MQKIHGRANHANTQGGGGVEQCFGYAAQDTGSTIARITAGRQNTGGMDSKSIQRLRELERENARLKRIVADQMLDITMLRDINSKNW